jgi:hypothetical protein
VESIIQRVLTLHECWVGGKVLIIRHPPDRHLDRAIVRNTVKIEITAELFLNVYELTFRSEDAFVDIDGEENDAPKQDISSTKVETSLGSTDRIDISGERNTNKVWDGL